MLAPATCNYIYNVSRLVCHEAEMVARSRELIAKSDALLKAPVPDRFLGRKTQEPFPQEEE
jgi:hypothetical protein